MIGMRWSEESAVGICHFSNKSWAIVGVSVPCGAQYICQSMSRPVF